MAEAAHPENSTAASSSSSGQTPVRWIIREVPVADIKPMLYSLALQALWA
jgi:hypothetical protein